MNAAASREHASGVVITALAATFGVALLQGVGLLAAAIGADRVAGSSGTVATLLQTVGLVFVVIAVYASAVVTTNTFAAIVAGRVKRIALRRLLGATARSERRAVSREGLAVGIAGAAIGLVAGTALIAALLGVGRLLGAFDGVAYSFANPVALIPAVAVLLTTWLAARIGSRRVLDVTPVQALGGAEERSEEEGRASRLRSVVGLKGRRATPSARSVLRSTRLKSFGSARSKSNGVRNDTGGFVITRASRR